MPWRFRLAAGAVSAALAGAAVVPMAGTADASARGAGSSPKAVTTTETEKMQAMPAGTVAFYRRGKRLLAHLVMYGLTPNSSHDVSLYGPGLGAGISLSPFTANPGGDAKKYLDSSYDGPLKPGSHLVVRMGADGTPVAFTPIAETARLQSPGGTHRLTSVEVGGGGYRYATPAGRVTIAYDSVQHTLTVTVSAGGLTPGPHAAGIYYDGSCERQGYALYTLPDLVASSRGKAVKEVRVITNVKTPIPAHGWYLTIHQGNSGNILSKGNPTIYFRPLLCANIKG